MFGRVLLNFLLLASSTVVVTASNFLANSNTGLTIKLLQNMNKNSAGDNLVFSPSSITTGLATLFLGMSDASRQAIANGNPVSFPLNENELSNELLVS